MSKRYSLEEVKRKIIDVLKDVDTGLSGIEIAEKTGINRLTITKYLNVLEAIGLVGRKKAGAVNIWHLKHGVVELDLPINMQDIQRLYMSALFNHAEDEARRLLINVIHSDAELLRIITEVMAPALNAAGELYRRGRITVTEVMFVTNMIEESLDLLKFNAGREDTKPEAYAVFMNAPGETRTVQSRMAAVAFYLKGWETYFLGNVASEIDLLFDIDLLKFLNKIWRTERGMMIMNVSVELKQHLKSVGETLKSVRAKLGKNLFVVAAGAAFDVEDELTAGVGADFYAKDLYSAVEWAEKTYKKTKW